MGKIFPQVTNLKAHPQLFDHTLELIEKSFHYRKPFTFKEDFAPLMNERNHHNCFILIDEKEHVLAHVGVKERKLKIKDEVFNITLLGGIAVDEQHRGEGHFQTLFTDVLAEKRNETAFFLLWSDQEKLYRKNGFYLCGEQFELDLVGSHKTLIQTKYHALSGEDKKAIQDLYTTSFARSCLTLERSLEDWAAIEALKSADLFIRRSDRITDYFFMNKGQDLKDVIYEYGTKGNLQEWLRIASCFGRVWTPHPGSENAQYEFFLCPGDVRTFSGFVSAFTNRQFKVQNINLMKQEVYFDFEDDTLVLPVEEFLRGVFGPGSFEELQNVPKLFLSGLDSV